MLEARLNATCSALAPFIKESRPESHFLRALGWFRAAGLAESKAHTIVADVKAPLSADVRRALMSLFEMLRREPRPEVAPANWAEYQRLCQPDSPDYILNLPDYYAFFTYSMFCGRVPEQDAEGDMHAHQDPQILL
jgi:demethylmenaquinone methyltransferase/2-methoxy-6-polyprenyl-1,4-benzoquinol methylase